MSYLTVLLATHMKFIDQAYYATMESCLERSHYLQIYDRSDRLSLLWNHTFTTRIKSLINTGILMCRNLNNHF